MKPVRLFLINAIIMTATSLLLGSASMWYNVYLTNKIGSKAMGVFHLLMSVYGFGITVAISGIGFAITRLVSEEMGKNPRANLFIIVRKCAIYALVFGGISGVILFCFAPVIGTQIIENQQTILAIRVMAMGLPFIALSAVLNGYFTAVRHISKSCISQLSDQFITILLTITLLSFFLKGDLETVFLSIATSGVVAEVITLCISYLLYKYDIGKTNGFDLHSPSITLKMLGIALPVALSSYLRSGLVSFRNLIVPSSLKKHGVSNAQSLSVFGIIHGLVMPVITFPAAFLNSFASLIIPELAQMRTKQSDIKSSGRINSTVSRMFQLSFLFAIAVSGILLFFSNQISSVVCKSTDISLYIRLFAPIVPFMYVDNVIDGMLKGLDLQINSMRYNIIDATVTLALVYTLLPIYGIIGYIFVLYASEILNFGLSFGCLIKATDLNLSILNKIVKPVICIVAASALIHFIMPWVPVHSPNITMISAIIVTILLFVWFLYLTGCLDSKDILFFKNIFHFPTKTN